MEFNEHNSLLAITLSNTEFHMKHVMKTQIFWDMSREKIICCMHQCRYSAQWLDFLTNTIYFYDEKHIIVKSNIATKYRIAVK